MALVDRVVVDFSAFYDGDKRVIIKEMSIIDVKSKCVQHWIFKTPKGTSPSDWTYGSNLESPNNKWLTRHYHGLTMESGITEYESLGFALDYIGCKAKVIYAVTTEKARILESLVFNRRSIVSLELLGCPPLKTDMMGKRSNSNDADQCLIHHLYAPNFYCTMENVKTVAKWCDEHPSLIDMNLAENRAKTFRDWQCSTPSPRELAEQGFIHCSTMGDSTKCVYCGIQLYRWDEGDNAAKDHEYNSPDCKFIVYSRQLAETEERGCSILKNFCRRADQGANTTTTSQPPSFHPDCELLSERDVLDACRV